MPPRQLADDPRQGLRDEAQRPGIGAAALIDVRGQGEGRRQPAQHGQRSGRLVQDERAEGDSGDGTAEGVTTAEHSLPSLTHDHEDTVRRAVGRIRDVPGEFFWRLDMQPFGCLN